MICISASNNIVKILVGKKYLIMKIIFLKIEIYLFFTRFFKFFFEGLVDDTPSKKNLTKGFLIKKIFY